MQVVKAFYYPCYKIQVSDKNVVSENHLKYKQIDLLGFLSMCVDMETDFLNDDTISYVITVLFIVIRFLECLACFNTLFL